MWYDAPKSDKLRWSPAATEFNGDCQRAISKHGWIPCEDALWSGTTPWFTDESGVQCRVVKLRKPKRWIKRVTVDGMPSERENGEGPYEMFYRPAAK